MSGAYYNENDPKAAAWLRELIKERLIAPGEVDERSIEDVKPDDVAGFRQCHWFAGVAGWSYALRLAGVSDETPVWTGSCPCQPFSAAGQRGGAADERHLWPVWFDLIRECRPPVIFGEQVASAAVVGRADGRSSDGAAPVWIDGVFADLESASYACAAFDLPAAGVGAPHIRQRLWWVADSTGARRIGPIQQSEGETRNQARMFMPGSDSADGRLEHAARDGRQQRWAESGGRGAAGGCGEGGLGDAGGAGAGRDGRAVPAAQAPGERQWVELGRIGHGAVDAGTADPWRNSVWLPCADGKARRIEPGLEPLVDGLPGRVAQLRGLGNAIVPQVAAEFVTAYLEAQ